MAEPHIRYCTSADGTRIAYVFSEEGRPPPVFFINYLFLPIAGQRFGEIMGTAIQRERQWLRLDRRGIGYSQRDVTDFSLDAQVADVLAVVTQAGVPQLDLAGFGDGVWVAAALAARHPELVRRLFLSIPTLAGGDPARRSIATMVRSSWSLGRGSIADVALGGNADADVRRAYIRFLAEATSPETAASYLEVDWDPSGELGSVAAPTLVVSTKRRLSGRTEASQALAAAIRGARLVATDATDTSAMYERAFEFLGDGEPPAPVASPGSAAATSAQRGAALQTVLFTDLVSHTEMMQRLGDDRGRNVLREHERITRDTLKQHGGAEVKTMGDGFLASFTSVTRAMDCAIALQRAFAARTRTDRSSDLSSSPEPLHVRVGLNAGEPIEEDGDLFGSTVILASRIAATAGPGEILIPEPLRHLLSGKSYVYADRGETMLKGFEDAVRLYEVRWRD
jgi:class 3 adenylate cyclase